MIWVLIVFVGTNMQPMAIQKFDYESACQRAAAGWRDLGYRVVCVQRKK